MKLYLVPERKATREKRHRSVTIKSSCNPVFEERYTLSLSCDQLSLSISILFRFSVDLSEDIESLKFTVYTATNAKMFKRNKVMLGFVEILFSENLLEKNSLSFTKWYELEQQDD